MANIIECDGCQQKITSSLACIILSVPGRASAHFCNWKCFMDWFDKSKHLQ